MLMMKVLIIFVHILLFSFVDVAVISTGGFIPFLILIYMMRLSCEAYDARKYNKRNPDNKVTILFTRFIAMNLACLVSLVLSAGYVYGSSMSYQSYYDYDPTQILIEGFFSMILCGLPIVVSYIILKVSYREEYAKGTKIIEEFKKSIKEEKLKNADTEESSEASAINDYSTSTKDEATILEDNPIFLPSEVNGIESAMINKIDRSIRYCKYCGKPINGTSKKCTGCGKQYFRAKLFWTVLSIIVLIWICLVSIIFNVIFLNTIESHEVDEEKVEFMDSHVVIVNTKYNKYHKYGCNDLDMDGILVFNEYNAEKKGYIPCRKCCND